MSAKFKSCLEELVTPVFSISPVPAAPAVDDPIAQALENARRELARARSLMERDSARLQAAGKDLADVSQEASRLRGIARIVRHHFDLSEGELFSRSRRQPIAFARQIAMSMGVIHLRLTDGDVAGWFGWHRSLVCYARQAVAARAASSASDRALIEKIEAEILSWLGGGTPERDP